MTHRQYLAWLKWSAGCMDHPTVDQQYMMQIAMEVVRTQAKNPGSVKFEDFKLRFGTPAKLADVEDSKAVWRARLGGD